MFQNEIQMLPKLWPNVAQILFQNKSSNVVQFWSRWFKVPFVAHIVVQCRPDYGLTDVQIMVQSSSKLFTYVYNFFLFIIHISTFFNNLWSNVAWLWSKWKRKDRTIFLNFTLECCSNSGPFVAQILVQNIPPKRSNYGSDVFKVSKCGSDCGPMWSILWF